jgi:hypothetical protein
MHGRWAETFRHLLLPTPAILVVRVLWDVAPVRIMLPASGRAIAAEEWSRPVQSLGSSHCSGPAVREGARRRGHEASACTPLVWPATMLAGRGKALTAGMTVSTGSLSPPQLRSVREPATMAISGLGEAHVTVRSAYTGAGLRGTLERGRGL